MSIGPFCCPKWFRYCGTSTSHVRHLPPSDEARLFNGGPCRRDLPATAARPAPARTVSDHFFRRVGNAFVDAAAKPLRHHSSCRCAPLGRFDPAVSKVCARNSQLPTSVRARTRFSRDSRAGVKRASRSGGAGALDGWFALKELGGGLHSAARGGSMRSAASALDFHRLSFDISMGATRARRAMGHGPAEVHTRHGRGRRAFFRLLSAPIEQEQPFAALDSAGKCRPGRTGHRPRALLERHRRICGASGACRLTDSKTTRGRRRNAATKPRYGQLRRKYGRHRARRAGPTADLGCSRGRARTPLATEKRPERWCIRGVEIGARGHGRRSEEGRSTGTECKSGGTSFAVMGLRLPEGIDPARYASPCRSARSIMRRMRPSCARGQPFETKD